MSQVGQPALQAVVQKIRGMYKPAELLALTWITVFLLLAGAIFALKIGSEVSHGASSLFAMLGFIALIAHRRVTDYVLAKVARGLRCRPESPAAL